MMATTTTRLRAVGTCGEEMSPSAEGKTFSAVPPSPLRNGLMSSSIENAGKINGYTLTNNGHVHSHGSTKAKLQRASQSKESFEKVSFITAALTHLGFYILMFLGFINQLFFFPKIATEKNREGYAPLYDNFEKFYLNYVYRRVRDCWNKPICSVPGATVTLKDRITNDYGWTFQFTGTETQCINLGSYNYLGFAEASGKCADESIEMLRKFGCASCSTRLELGTMPIHNELEKLTAKFLGVEDAIVFGMGFATNSLNLPSLVDKNCLSRSKRGIVNSALI
ncbi:serine palmitoyltransferase 2 [Pogonomyrmex barbatus]|uniref:Serine palmitoyltransferase 2 n=1 Tax=Pogonomyrmex barbatus TaxID=144034 RepID=A0A6I9VQC1_9HYME|nr:serine palmitoyltransferase 2 [Pogonomyrmex barbatus]